jgi:hypothetical protein
MKLLRQNYHAAVFALYRIILALEARIRGRLKESYEGNTTIYRHRANSAVIRLRFRVNIMTGLYKEVEYR